MQAENKFTINTLVDTILFNCDSFNLKQNVDTILFKAV